MSDKDIVRAWKDDEYRRKLADQGQAIPGNPAGEEELSDEDLEKVAGGLPMSHGRAVPQPPGSGDGGGGDPSCRQGTGGGATDGNSFDCSVLFTAGSACDI